MTGQRFSVLLAVLVAVGCTQRKDSTNEIRVHLPSVNFKVDPQKMEDAYSMLIVSQLYRGLLRFNPTGNVVPSLAESWTESSDRLSYRFKIKAATFSDGTPITAKHVQQTFARLFYVGAGMSADLDYIKGVDEFLKTHDVSKLGVKVISAREVEFQLAQPSALFLKQIAVADCSILPLESFDSTLADGASGVFSGPYRIASMKPGYFELSKWRKDEFDSALPPDRIEFFASEENPIALAAVGKTDSLDRDPVTPAQAAKLTASGWGMVPTELTGESFVILNPTHLSPDLREYLFKKLDPDTLVEKLGEVQFKPAFGLIPNGFQGTLAKSETEGLRDSKAVYRGKKTAFTLDFDPASEWEQRAAEYLKTLWSTDRITVTLNPLSKGAKLQRMFSKTSEAVLGQKGIDYPDGFSVLTYFKGKYDSNYFHVDDPLIDREIAGVLRNFDSRSRSAKYKAIQKAVLAHHTIVPLFFGSHASGFWSNRVRSAPSHPMGYHTMAFESIEMRLK